jgi:hypothetical protein
MDALTSGISGLFSKAKETVASATQSVAAPVKETPIAPLVTPEGAKMVGMDSEPAGYTSGGGRRLKTRSASKKRRGGARKTRSASKKRHTKKH